MSNSRILRIVLLIGTLLVLSAVIAAGVYTGASQKQRETWGRTYDAVKVTEAPEVVSKIKDLEIAGVTLIDQGMPHAALNIDVINHRDEDVMAIDLIAGNKLNVGGISMDGLMEEGKQSVIVGRHSLRTFTWHLGEIMEGETVFLAAAIFSDGKEEGDKHFLEGIKKSRLHYQERRRQEKNGGQQ